MNRRDGRLGRSLLGPTIATLAGIAVLLALGTWQLHRLSWKHELIATLESRLAKPPFDAATMSGTDLAYRPARATGVFLHDKEFHIAGRTNNDRLGYHVITPLRMAGEGIVLVNRGWVPLDRKAPETRAEGLPRGSVTVEGMVRAGQAGGWFTPENEPARNMWYFVDIDAMAAHAGLDRVRPYFIEVGPAADPTTLPLSLKPRVGLRNEHLGYALTWYALAIALGVIYVIFRRRHRV